MGRGNMENSSEEERSRSRSPSPRRSTRGRSPRRSKDYQKAEDILNDLIRYGRKELYPFGFKNSPDQSVVCAACNKVHDNGTEMTWDHITPLTTLFDNDPFSVRLVDRKDQFFKKENLQPMCRSKNSSKGSEGVSYNQRKAKACMIFIQLNWNTKYEDILVQYGKGSKTEKEVLDFIHNHG